MIAIHGGGYTGLTCAVHFANAGLKVVVYDPSPDVVKGINDRTPKAGEFLAYLKDNVAWANLSATNRREDVEDAPVHILCVPTERMGRPCDDIVVESLLWLIDEAAQGATIIVESTLIPGTIDSIRESVDFKVRVGSDLALAVAPRRDWFADPDKNLGNLERVVGGYTANCTKRAVEVLSKVSPKVMETDYRTAEITKALENALLHVPLMLVHQLAVAMPDRNIAEAVRLASTHWRLIKGMHLNFGTGGRCVPLGTRYLVEAAGAAFSIGEEADYFETLMRQKVAAAIAKHLPPPARVLVMGMAYRPSFKDMGLSPGLDVARHLEELGYQVKVHDPMWSAEELETLTGLDAATDEVDDWYCRFDAIVLATPHSTYLEAGSHGLGPHVAKGTLIFDAQGAWKKFKPRFKEQEAKYIQVGTPGWTGEKGK